MPGGNEKWFDWSLTYSTEEDVQTLPEPIKEMLECDGTVAAVAIAEFSEKWHIHAAFRSRRGYTRKYGLRNDRNPAHKTWWERLFEPTGIKHPALEIKPHDNIFGLAGGYLSKTEGTKVLHRHGFTDEQLEYGVQEHLRKQRRQKGRKFCEQFIVVHPAKAEVLIGFQRNELGCTESEALYTLAEDGWAFATSKRGYTEVYQQLSADRHRHEQALSGSS